MTEDIVLNVTTKPDPIIYLGYTIEAPGFTTESFSAALDRAMSEGITITPGAAPRTFVVHNPVNDSFYVANRYGCQCAAGLHRQGCKHLALVLLAEVIEPANRPIRPP